jgi:cell division transport system permease protein
LPSAKSTSYFYAIFSITLVLFVLGMAAVITIEARKLSTTFKENLLVEVVLKDDVTPDKAKAMQAQLQTRPYIRNIRYISKDEAAKILEKDLGEKFLDILNENPLYSSLNINLVESYANRESFDGVKQDLSKFPEVQQVNIQNNILESLDSKVQSASFIIVFVAIALLIFAVSLIFNTIRLAMFSNRFLIKTQQLFGATRWFIIKPFLGRSILNGFISGLIACLLIESLIFYFDHTFPEIGLLRDLFTFAVLFGAVTLFGILISFLSTLIALLRYLRLKVEDLY